MYARASATYRVAPPFVITQLFPWWRVQHFIRWFQFGIIGFDVFHILARQTDISVTGICSGMDNSTGDQVKAKQKDRATFSDICRATHQQVQRESETVPTCSTGSRKACMVSTAWNETKLEHIPRFYAYAHIFGERCEWVVSFLLFVPKPLLLAHRAVTKKCFRDPLHEWR